MPDQPTYDGYSTGALYRPPDPRNFLMSCIPDVQAQLAVGYPDTDEHLREHCPHIYDQNGTPACTTHFTAGMMTCNEHIERKGETLIFDAMGLFNETGPPNVGRYTGDILKRAQDVGVVRVGTTKRYRIGSYAFAPTSSVQEWVDTMKVAVVGYRPDAFLILNSWSANWGRGGFGWVPISFLVQSNFQSGYTFGNTILDAIDDDLAPTPTPTPKPPTPTPTKRVVVTATAVGGGMEFLKAGSVLTASGGGFSGTLMPTNVAIYEDPAPPGPNPPEPPNPPNPPTPPDPGGMKIEATARGSGLYVWVRDAAGASVGATVKRSEERRVGKECRS